MDNVESELVKIVKVTLAMVVVSFLAALWFRMDTMMVNLKYMRDKVDWLEGSVPACGKEEKGLYE